jgi:peptidoglycan/xylan/chitin deacetylase (PgdA/CDA1 family)
MQGWEDPSMKSVCRMVKSIAGWAVVLLIPLTLGCPTQRCITDPVEGVYVNIQVDAELDDTEGLARIVNALEARGISATVYVTGDYAIRNATRIQDLYKRGHEIALHGYCTGEQLATMPYADQLSLLYDALVVVQGCQPCGTFVPVSGFRPQSFSQNEDTYDALDALGLVHNSGYKAGVLYEPGHETDFVPYPVTGHGFYAVPITTVGHGGGVVHLCDVDNAVGGGMSAEDWDELLQNALAEAIANHRPLVVVFHGWYTGARYDYDYWEPFIDFLEAARCSVTFVTTQELVDLFTP